jgi:hypothetical protein
MSYGFVVSHHAFLVKNQKTIHVRPHWQCGYWEFDLTVTYILKNSSLQKKEFFKFNRNLYLDLD